jgi:hypothetical protein
MLPARFGGLGLIDSLITAPSAKISTFINSYQEINYHFKNIDFINNNNYNYIHNSISFIKNNVLNENKQKYSFEQIITNYAQSNSTSLKLQNIFTKEMIENMQYNFIDCLSAK